MSDLNHVVKDISVTTVTQGESLNNVRSKNIETFDNIQDANKELEITVQKARKRTDWCSSCIKKCAISITIIVLLLLCIILFT